MDPRAAATGDRPFAADEASGFFLTFEGGDGVGKTHQVRLITARLRAKGIAALHTREPGGTKRAERIRRALLTGAIASHGADIEAVVLAAARLDHMQRRIVPALNRGGWVVCDRFVESTRVYQEALGGANPALITKLETAVVSPHWPDVTFLLDAPVDVILHRLGNRGAGRAAAGTSCKGDPFEILDPNRLEAIRQAFLAVARRDPDRIVVIPADQSADRVTDMIWEVIADRMPPEHRLAGQSAGDLAARRG